MRSISTSSTLLLILAFFIKIESKRIEDSGCQFPEEWEGIWFQSTVRPYIKIDADSISSKGKCTQSDLRGEKFLIKESRNCFKCIVIHQKHQNVLQYKETVRCSKKPDLHRVCSDIAGDANLYTLFRVDGQGIECPFGTQHGFRFAYNRGKGDCEWPESELEPCTDNKRMVLNYQACPNVQGSELMSEKVECQASWKDGSRHYLVGKLDHPHATTDEDKFRCFVYEYVDPLKPSEGLYLAQSGDATCNGLFSPHEGSRTLSLKKAPSKIGCTFPPWLEENSWSTVDASLMWEFSGPSNLTWINMTTVTTNNFGGITSYVAHQESKVWCHKITSLDNGTNKQAEVILYKTEGCSSGFVCAQFSLLAPGVLRVKLGSLTRTLEYACDASQFRHHPSSHLLLSGGSTSSAKVVTTGDESKGWIPSGLYHVKSDPRILTGYQSGQQMSAAVRADFPDNPGKTELCQDGMTPKVIAMIVDCLTKPHSDLEMRSTCLEDDFPKEYENTHSWSENGTDFRVYKPLDSQLPSSRSFCLAFNAPQMNVEGHSSSSSKEKSSSKKSKVIAVQKLDSNCQPKDHIQKRTISSVSEVVNLSFEGECSSSTTAAMVFGFHQKDKLFMILLNLSLFHFCLNSRC